MRALALAAGLMLGGLSLVFAMVVRLAEPSLAWSLIGYAMMCAGMLLGVAAGRGLARTRR